MWSPEIAEMGQRSNDSENGELYAITVPDANGLFSSKNILSLAFECTIMMQGLFLCTIIVVSQYKT